MDTAHTASPILVTGAAGFIGARVTELLLDQGHPVVGVDNLNDAYDVRLKQWRLTRLAGRPGLEFHRLDIADRDTLHRLFTDYASRVTPSRRHDVTPFSAIINLAARAGVRQSVANPWVYVETNVTGTLNLLELCREFGVKKFVLASTSSLYSGNPTLPYREDLPTDRPLSPYAASKKAAEALCYTYHALHGMDVVVLRYFTVYGPGGRPDMSLFRFVQWIGEDRPVMVYGDGSQSRDFTYVDDIARGTIAAVRYVDQRRWTNDDGRATMGERPSSDEESTRRSSAAGGRSSVVDSRSSMVDGHSSLVDGRSSVVDGRSSMVDGRSPVFEIINLGSDRPVVLMDAVHLVEELMGKKAHIEYRPRHPADVMATWADITKAERLLGWRPQVSFREGVERLVKWYQENRTWAREIVTT